ncbi:MAG: CRTAC1 family protein [Pirellulaceae bacterium]|nr:CRTAC1 family protein [Pirellulaceae bacterium]
MIRLQSIAFAPENRVQPIAWALVLISYLAACPPAINSRERQQLASRFHFVRFPLDIEPFAEGELKKARPSHPSLQRISAWISGTGAAASVADLDSNGLENDLILIDPRLDQVVVMPTPSTSSNRHTEYEAFVLNVRPLPFDDRTMSPTGSLVGDFNEDGAADVLVYFWGRTPVIFLQRIGDQSSTTPPTRQLSAADFFPVELLPDLVGAPEGRWYTHAANQADFDGDGHLDLMLGNFFQDGADILNERGTGIAAVMHQGKSRARNGGGAKLFVWSGASSGERPTVTYRNESAAIEKHCGHGWVLAAGAADLDRDGLPELYIAHDFGPDRLLHNRSKPSHVEFGMCEGRRSFTTPRSFVLGRDSFKGMGVGFGDVNGDGYLDIFVSNIADAWALQESHFLWVSTGEIEAFKQNIAPYVQQSERYGLSRSGWGWDSVLADLDNDGKLEALQATGFAKGAITKDTALSPLDRLLYENGFLQHGISRWPELQAVGTTNDRLIQDPRAWPKISSPTATLSGYDKNPFYVQSQNGRYVDIAADIDIGDPFNTRGIAIADTDGNGLLDFVYANQWEPSVFFRNESPSDARWLTLRLLLPVDETYPFSVDPSAIVTSSPAVGATATIRPLHASDGQVPRVHSAEVLNGTGHSGHGGQELHFGLGRYSSDALDVDIQWRSRTGVLQSKHLRLNLGRHTVLLGNTDLLENMDQ